MAYKVKLLLASTFMGTQLFGCATAPQVAEKPYTVGVVNFQQCRPDMVLKEIGYNDIAVRNEANDCSRLGMPKIFAAELARELKSKVNNQVVLVPLDVPYNYNIRSQIDIARGMSVDYVIGGKIDKYIDPAGPQRGKYSGILPNTATLSPTPSKIADNAKTEMQLDLTLARTADGKIIAQYNEEFEGDKNGYEYTKGLAEKIATDIIRTNKQ